MSDEELPPEVIEAAERLKEHKPFQSIPPLFQEIMSVDAEIAEIRALGSSMTQDDWKQLGALRRYRQQFLVPAAELALRPGPMW